MNLEELKTVSEPILDLEDPIVNISGRPLCHGVKEWCDSLTEDGYHGYLSFVHISNICKAIYFETPKCGSISLKTILKDTFPSENGCIPASKLENYYKFIVVRNPWDRMVSNYHNMIGYPENHVCLTLGHQPTFEEFIRFSAENHDHHWENYSSFFMPSIKFDRIIRFENFATEINELFAHLNISCDLIHENKTEHLDYQHYYNAVTRKIVADKFAVDIEAYNYSF